MSSLYSGVRGRCCIARLSALAVKSVDGHRQTPRLGYTRPYGLHLAKPTNASAQKLQWRALSSLQTPPVLDPIDPVGPALTVLAFAVCLVGGVMGYVYITDTRALAYKWAVMPALHYLCDPEDSHKLSIWLARHSLVPSERTSDDDVLATKPGNPKPRMFRLPQDKAVINRYGFNSEGHEAVAQRLNVRIRKFLYKHHVPSSTSNSDSIASSILSPLEWLNTSSTVSSEPSSATNNTINRSLHTDRLLGVNLGKNKTTDADSDDDYISGITTMSPYADYIVINISSPNTPGLRSLQSCIPIERLLRSAKKERDALPKHHQPPLVVKIAPDLSPLELSDIAAVVESVGIDGVIISNTTISRPDTLQSDAAISGETGGLSGAPVLPLALHTVSEFYRLTGGRVPIIGCGGIQTAADALKFAKAGAVVVQVYTALGYQGPGLVHDIKADLTRALKADGVSWSQVVGADHRK
ncbi:dihydroorotate dehydrogenase (fumarate) [Batrachochytrium salamandrivorans]|nr:dihydroorotate dehydrogenase (fumarate) [Batrachochytrium salamandrivorans]